MVTNTTERFQLLSLGQATQAPPAFLQPTGTLVFFDVCPPVATSHGQAFLMPLPAGLRTFDPHQPLPALNRSAPPPDLRALLASLRGLCTTTTQHDRLVICPPGEQVALELP